MKSLIVSAVVAVILSAASVTAQTTACAAQSIVEACLGTTEGNLKLCSPTDYTCLCEAHKAILT